VQIEPSLSAELAIRILIGFSAGAIIGVERQKAAREEGNFKILGIRSFGLLSLLGTLTSIAADLIPQIALIFLIVSSILAIILIGGHTWYKITQTKRSWHYNVYFLWTCIPNGDFSWLWFYFIPG